MKLDIIKLSAEAENLAEKLHGWYLEASKKIDPDNYNDDAQVAYKDLNDDQKFLDRYIANKTIKFIKGDKDED